MWRDVGGGRAWATIEIRQNYMKTIESTLEQDGEYLATTSDPSLRPALLEGVVMQFTMAEGGGGGRDLYLAEGERLLNLIREGQQLGITKDEELVAVYWDASALALGVESPPSLEFEILDPTTDEQNNNNAVVYNPNWRDGKTVDEMMQYVCENDEGTRKDVTFYIGPGRVPISAHRNILALMSIVLDYALLESPRIQAGPQDHLHMAISNASPHAFKMFLKYIYCRRVDWSLELDRVTEAICLMKLAQQLQMRDLLEQCATQVKEHINEDNALGILAHAHDLRHRILTKYALDFIAANGRRILFQSEFNQLSPECFSMILKQDELNMAEISVLNAAIRWAEYRIHSRLLNTDVKVSGENIRRELGRALYLIRFPLLGGVAFGLVLREHAGLLDERDELSIHRFSLGVNPDASPFSATPRIHHSPATSPTNQNQSDKSSTTDTEVLPSSPATTLEGSPKRERVLAEENGVERVERAAVPGEEMTSRDEDIDDDDQPLWKMMKHSQKEQTPPKKQKKSVTSSTPSVSSTQEDTPKGRRASKRISQSKLEFF